MPERLSSAGCKDSQELACSSRKDARKEKPRSLISVEFCVQTALAWFFQLLLHTFFDLQDSVLAIGFIRRLVAFALAPRCQATVQSHLKLPSTNRTSFEELQYHVPDDARELLVHASLHALILPPHATGFQLPAMGRILLQTGIENSGKFQEAVAGALAHELQASLLVVDDGLLAEVAVDALGESGENADEAASSLWAYLLSFWLSGGKVAFVWDVLHRICSSCNLPLVIFVRDVEQTICGSYEAYDAFVDAFGSLGKAAPLTGQQSRQTRNIVLLGGTSLGERGLDVMASKNLERLGQDAGRPGTTAGADDTFSLLPELSLVIPDERPNPRKLLDKLFMTRVKLEPPASGAPAEQHRRQLAQDAADLTAERNLHELTSLGLQKSSLPALSSAVLRNRQLSRDEWTKIVTWAKSMEAIIRTKEALNLVEDMHSNENSLMALVKSQKQPSGIIRRSLSSMDSKGMSLEDIATTLKQLKKARKSKDSKKGANGLSVETSNSSSQGHQGGNALSERALWYGLRMLERAGTGMRPPIKTDNMYERRLLQEVIRPEDAGSGFANVGALSEAKDALREVVQLPLQHPNLFASGSLAQLTKGVLLFGPPGTGKTMLARAAAAECGASFLAIHPSAVASKWLGDGVRYVRATFSLAAKLAPCVIFFDEVDALLSRRNSHNEHESLREMKNEAMAQWDGIRPTGMSPKNRVVVLGATNRPQDLDEAVLRRFARRIFCDMPNSKARKAILEVILAGEKLADDVDLRKIAERTDGFSGSDLRQVCTAAAMRPLRELLRATGKSAQVAKSTTKHPLLQKPPQEDAPASSNTPQPVEKEQPLANGHSSPQAAATASGEEFHPDAVQPQKSEELGKASASEASIPPMPGPHIEAQANGAPASTSKGAEPVADARTGSMQAEAARSTGDGGGGNASPGSRVEMMSMLLEECDRMADTANSMSQSQLRLITAEDFEEACKQVSPSMDEYSHTMDELRSWNAKFGEGTSKYHNPKLSYFI